MDDGKSIVGFSYDKSSLRIRRFFSSPVLVFGELINYSKYNSVLNEIRINSQRQFKICSILFFANKFDCYIANWNFQSWKAKKKTSWYSNDFSLLSMEETKKKILSFTIRKEFLKVLKFKAWKNTWNIFT